MNYDVGAHSENQESPIGGKLQDIRPILTSLVRETKRAGHMTKVTGVCTPELSQHLEKGSVHTPLIRPQLGSD